MHDPETGKATYALGVLLFGWAEILLEGFSAWLANPLWLLTLVLILVPVPRPLPLATSLAGLALALSFLLYESILLDEAGNKGEILGYGPGYWLWGASFVALLVTSMLPVQSSESPCI
ncbi:hypothetical protein Mal4_02130 [Maioricimonas rarisocia]|uniref:Uncharacterized protein n=1 Tax=Maioricimonas rarisocia TaxID=2528026 RepID=A0A517Z0B6_9PLAN|nr:hypothetical protein [Maioricimonas rarisocia]QDU35931.1 hypothetical protein Mal4_02130 [Maioricimonas rarisocia]